MDTEELIRGPEGCEGDSHTEKARRADRTDAPKKANRERKPNDDKRFLIDALVWAVTTDIEQAGDNVLATDVEIINTEREFLFTYNGTKYKVVLSVPRGQ